MSCAGLTNQALYFCRLNLDKVQDAQSPQDKQQLEESALFHLYSGLMRFCHELVSHYNLAPFSDIDELCQRQNLPSELYEITLLKADANSWLNVIVGQYQRLILQGLSPQHSPVELILSQSDYTDLFRNHLIELEKTIQRMRECCQEN